MLEVHELGKRYAGKWALRGVSFSAGAGLVGLVGPNGAGKTTLMRILAALIRPDEGRAAWDGIQIRPGGRGGETLRQRLGYLPQNFGVYPDLSARQFLHYLAAMKGLSGVLAQEQVEKSLAEVNLSDAADRKLKEFSQGMKQRVGIAQALLNDPELLIIDEPTVGLDPEERLRFRGLLATLAEDRLILLSTHIIADVEAVAPRLLLLRQGALLEDTAPAALIAAVQGAVWSVTVDSAAAADLRRRGTCSQAVLTTQGSALRLVAAARPHPDAVPVEPTLEEAYLFRMINR
jgi:ABC-type multidrug transport system ATPase subunit